MDMTEKGRNHGFWRAVAQCVAGIIALAVGCLAYHFAPPFFSLRVRDPFNIVAIIAFLTVPAVISHLACKLRSRAEQLASTNAAAFSSNCRQGQ
jgi:K+-sensing histidine kinase KdpD